jgi:hypothetical protein
MVFNENTREPGRLPQNDSGVRAGHNGANGTARDSATPSETNMPPESTATTERDELFKQASRAQRAEIVKHREAMSRRCGHLISLDEAARDWIKTNAARWREEFLKKLASH